jgi:iron(III) transport system substrate-binding protein
MRQSMSIATILAGCVMATTANAQGACAVPRQIEGFKTCADIAAAEKEGAFVLYTTDPEDGTAKLLAGFEKTFPRIKTNFIRLQAGALYAKLNTERQAKAFLADAMEISDMGFVLDFQKRGGYMNYVSPEMSAYKTAFKSQPEGLWTWGSIIMAGIAYNPKLVTAEEAPKNWKDMLDPKWAGLVNVKVSASGLQHETWYELRRLYGDEYFATFANQKPRAFDSYVQQFDRMVNGQDKVIHTAQYSGYLQFKAKGAPVEFVSPPEGLPAGPEVYGIIAEAPHPNAAKLFMDWFLSVPGQTALGVALSLNSAREDVPAPAGGKPIGAFKLLFPADWQAFLETHKVFVREWDKITGVR